MMVQAPTFFPGDAPPLPPSRPQWGLQVHTSLHILSPRHPPSPSLHYEEAVATLLSQVAYQPPSCLLSPPQNFSLPSHHQH